jgi:hypothetical protein
MNPIEGQVVQQNVALGYFKQNKQNVAAIQQMRLLVLFLSWRAAEGLTSHMHGRTRLTLGRRIERCTH